MKNILYRVQAQINHPLLKGGQSGKMDSKKGLVFLQAPSIVTPPL